MSTAPVAKPLMQELAPEVSHRWTAANAPATCGELGAACWKTEAALIKVTLGSSQLQTSRVWWGLACGLCHVLLSFQRSVGGTLFNAF